MAGYELHIEKKGGISLESWLQLCESDPSLTYENSISFTNPHTKEVITIDGEGMCVWGVEGSRTTFDFRTDKISFKYSDDALVKAKEIAIKLKATIRGDEGERY